jgi:hypothetical protein
MQSLDKSELKSDIISLRNQFISQQDNSDLRDITDDIPKEGKQEIS